MSSGLDKTLAGLTLKLIDRSSEVKGSERTKEKEVLVTLEDIFGHDPNPLKINITERAKGRFNLEQFQFLQAVYDANKELHGLLEEKSDEEDFDRQMADFKSKLEQIAATYVDTGGPSEVNTSSKAKADLSPKGRSAMEPQELMAAFSEAFTVVFNAAVIVSNLMTTEENRADSKGVQNGIEKAGKALVGEYEKLQQLKADREQVQQMVDKLSADSERLKAIQNEIQGREEAKREATRSKSFLSRVGQSVKMVGTTLDSVKVGKAVAVLEKAREDLQAIQRTPTSDPDVSKELTVKASQRYQQTLWELEKEVLALQKGTAITMTPKELGQIKGVATEFTGARKSRSSAIVQRPDADARASLSRSVSLSDVAVEVSEAKEKKKPKEVKEPDYDKLSEQAREKEGDEWNKEIDTFRRQKFGHR